MSNLQLIVVSILGWGIGSVFYKVANDNLHPIMVSILVTALYVVLLPMSFAVTKVDTNVNFSGALASLAGGLCMCVGSLAYFYALKRGGAGEVTTVTALYPALTLVLSIFFLKEEITFRKIVGVGLALISVFILSKK